MKNKTHLNMPGFKLPHMGGEKQVGPYKSALHFNHDKVNPFAPEEKVPSFQDAFMKGGIAGAGVGSSGNVDKDSIAMSDAWKRFNKAYLDRTTHPATGKPIDMDYNINELNAEGNEFYLKKMNDGSYKPRLIPTDDAEMRDEKFLSTLQPGQLFTPYQPEDE